MTAERGSEKLPIKMMNDRILVKPEADSERKTLRGILIPATAQMAKRLAWAQVVAAGPNVRAMEPGKDQVLFNPEDRYEVEVRGDDYIILRAGRPRRRGRAPRGEQHRPVPLSFPGLGHPHGPESGRRTPYALLP